MSLLIPFISSFCFRSGGVGKDDSFCPPFKPPTPWANKWWRWGMGLPIAILTQCWLLIPAYFIATNVFVYGDKSWLNFLGRDLKWLTYGFVFGACSFFCLPFGYGLIQSLLGAVSFWALMSLSNKGLSMDWFGELTKNDYWRKRVWYLNHCFVELGFGFIGVIMYVLPR